MSRAWLLALLAACSAPTKHAIDPDAAVDAPPLLIDAAPDTGAPDTMIVEGPATFSPYAQAAFTFTSDDPHATFTCSIDGDTPIACASPYSRTLADGNHMFSVRAIDAAGNSDDTPAEHSWTIDTVAPNTQITAAPPAADNSPMVTFAFTASELSVTFDCAIDGGTYAACTSGQAFGPLGDGAHAFAVRAHDRAGNVDASPAIRSWSIDTSTPDTAILSGPTGSTSATGASFTFISPDAGTGATFQCKLDAAAFAPCTSPAAYAALAEGSHTFLVKVTDAVGNSDPTPATRTWKVDLTPPTTAITMGPTGTVASASATIAFSANESATFDCSIDGAAYSTCSSPLTLTGLAQGAHTIAVRATDDAGHVDPSPATRAWTVDTVAPDITFTAGPANNATVGPRLDFAFTTTEGTPTCSLDGAAFAACISPHAFNIQDGAHTFAVRATDGAGNVTTVTRAWTTACAAPTSTGAIGLLHLDDGMQAQVNATGGAGATLGDTAAVEPTDPTALAAARFGGGLTLASGTHVAWPLAAAASATPTVMLWIKPTAGGTVFATGDGLFQLTVNANLSITATGHTATVSSAQVAAGMWHHIAVSLGPNLILWVDGVRTQVVDPASTAIALTQLTLGGTYAGAADELWVGAASVTTDDEALADYCPL